jgi:hypothetical protein
MMSIESQGIGEEIERLREDRAALIKALSESQARGRHLFNMHVELQRAVSALNPIMERASECQECGIARTPEWRSVRDLILIADLQAAIELGEGGVKITDHDRAMAANVELALERHNRDRAAYIIAAAREEGRQAVYNEAIILVMPTDREKDNWPDRRRAIIDYLHEMGLTFPRNTPATGGK